MAVNDYTEVVAWFSDEAAAEVFAKFVASEGMPCHITDIRKATRFEQFGVRVQRHRIDELRQILRLKAVANGVTPIAAQSMGRRVARAGIPCCVAGEQGHPSTLSATALCGTREIGHIVAVPETFLSQAVRILDVAPPPNADLTADARNAPRSQPSSLSRAENSSLYSAGRGDGEVAAVADALPVDVSDELPRGIEWPLDVGDILGATMPAG